MNKVGNLKELINSSTDAYLRKKVGRYQVTLFKFIRNNNTNYKLLFSVRRPAAAQGQQPFITKLNIFSNEIDDIIQALTFVKQKLSKTPIPLTRVTQQKSDEW